MLDEIGTLSKEMQAKLLRLPPMMQLAIDNDVMKHLAALPEDPAGE